MTTKALGTATKLANLQQLKKERIAKIEAQLEAQQSQLLQKRKEELFTIFKACNSLTIDDRLLVGFLKFVKNVDNKNHPFLNELKEVHQKSKMPSKPKSGNVKTD
jgi:exonuclease VII large subunit